MNEKEQEFFKNASSVLRLWAAYASSGGFDKPAANVPSELLDLDDRVSTEVPALIGICLAIHAKDRDTAACTILSIAAKLAQKSPDAVMKVFPMATGLAKWAGADRDVILRGMGCVAAMTLMRSGRAIAPNTSITLKEMVRDGAVWSVSLPGSDPCPVGLATLGSALTTYMFPAGDTWIDLAGAPEPELFSGWAAYLYGGGLDRPIASVHFSLTGVLGKGGQLLDTATTSVIGAAICLAANDLKTDATNLLGTTEMCVREAGGDIKKLLILLAERVGPFSQLATKAGRGKSEGASGCFTALALWQVGLMRCLDPHHTLRRMAMSQDTRFVAKEKTYTIGEFSRMQVEVLRDIQGGDDGS